jgi:hypothetical protein
VPPAWSNLVSRGSGLTSNLPSVVVRLYFEYRLVSTENQGEPQLQARGSLTVPRKRP